jgi:hypothetical protein
MLFQRQGADVPGIERQYMHLIYRRLALPAPSAGTARRVHEADMRARATELRDVVDNPKGIVIHAPTFHQTIKFTPWDKVFSQGVVALDSYLFLAQRAVYPRIALRPASTRFSNCARRPNSGSWWPFTPRKVCWPSPAASFRQSTPKYPTIQLPSAKSFST